MKNKIMKKKDRKSNLIFILLEYVSYKMNGNEDKFLKISYLPSFDYNQKLKRVIKVKYYPSLFLIEVS